MPPTGPRAEHKRRQIVRAARAAFLHDGFDVGMDAIATAAGVSKVTVYNHFSSKEELFVAIVETAITEAQSAYLDDTPTRLGESTDIRTDLVKVCRQWVHSLDTVEMIALRTLVAGELRRFPELGTAWLATGPDRMHAAIAAGLRALVDRGELTIPDIHLAILQLSGLVLSPHIVYGGYGRSPDADLTEQLVTSGVDMFLTHYSRSRAKSRH